MVIERLVERGKDCVESICATYTTPLEDPALDSKSEY